MKKILLSIVAVVVLTASSAFGYYHAGNFIDFLVHGNQMRVRLDRLGFNAGTENIRVALGLTGATGDVILENLTTGSKDYGINKFLPAALVGVGYKTEMFGVGLGYQFKYISSRYQVHTPVITATAMNNAFRINVPVHIGIGSGNTEGRGDNKGSTAISIDPQIRYYTGLEAFSHFRLYIRYGEATFKDVTDGKIGNDYAKFSSVGFQLRLYFGAMVGDILVEPILRVQYDQSLKTASKSGGESKKESGFSFDVTANNRGATTKNSSRGGGYIADLEKVSELGYFIQDPYRLGVAVPVGFTANSDIVSLYLEPALSFTMLSGKRISRMADDVRRKDPFYTFGYVVYGEIYIRPLPALEWYFEAETGGATVANGLANLANTSLVFNTSTGITWYF